MKKNELYKAGREFNIETKKTEQLLLKITGLSKSQLFLVDEIEEKYIKEIKNSLYRLGQGEPLEYLINNAEFYSLDFFVNSDVLVPRDDTEIMVDKAIETIIELEKVTLIDVGTGTSCIPISIIQNSEKIYNCYVVDISEKALAVSRKNIINYYLGKKVKQVHGNLLDQFMTFNDHELNKDIIITANLPYIKYEDFNNIDKETVKFEPALALYGGKNTGFELYEQLIRECIQLKSINNLNSLILFIEIGFDQKEYSENYLKDLNLKFEIFKDNSNIDRCIKIEF